MKEFTDLFIHMWDRSGVTGANVACLWPNDTDANAFRAGFPPAMKPTGYKPIDSGAYQDGISDFSAQIAKFKSADCELFTCAPLPPDFQTFWKQAAQQGYKPKFATVAKVMLFPSEAVALGPLANNIATDCWWSPYHPYKSSLDGTTPQQLADDFTAATGKQWTQALGSIYSLFEIAVQAFTGASDPKDHDDVAKQLHDHEDQRDERPPRLHRRPAAGRRDAADRRRAVAAGHQVPVGHVHRRQLPTTSVPLNGDLQLTNP